MTYIGSLVVEEVVMVCDEPALLPALEATATLFEQPSDLARTGEGRGSRSIIAGLGGGGEGVRG